jgi:hypothetical protein
LVTGCASPGPPHAPSLYLPKPPGDLKALREGDLVTLTFTAPMRSTDDLPLKSPTMQVSFCRQIERAACVAVAGPSHEIATSKPGAPRPVELTDTLPPELTHGRSQLLGYRLEAFNAAGQTAGWSDPAYAAAGDAPPAVANLRVEGSRLGAVLQWSPANADDGAVVIERAPATAAEKPGAEKIVRLAANGPERTLDASATPDMAYRYTAVRERTVQLGGRALELRSAPSQPVPFTLRLVYPPPVPTGLTAAGFTTPATATDAAGYAEDLIWQPVDDAGLLAPLAGYNVYREALNGAARIKLNAAPIQVPAFHDATAEPGVGYRYSVAAVDIKGNESAAVTAVTQP